MFLVVSRHTRQTRRRITIIHVYDRLVIRVPSTTLANSANGYFTQRSI